MFFTKRVGTTTPNIPPRLPHHFVFFTKRVGTTTPNIPPRLPHHFRVLYEKGGHHDSQHPTEAAPPFSCSLRKGWALRLPTSHRGCPTIFVFFTKRVGTTTPNIPLRLPHHFRVLYEKGGHHDSQHPTEAAPSFSCSLRKGWAPRLPTSHRGCPTIFVFFTKRVGTTTPNIPLRLPHHFRVLYEKGGHHDSQHPTEAAPPFSCSLRKGWGPRLPTSH